MSRFVGSTLIFCVLALAFAGTAAAQSVYWNPPAELGQGQPGSIDLVFESCSPEDDVSFPATNGLVSLGPPNESRMFSMVNFKSTSSVTLAFPVRAGQPGTVVLPAFEVETSEGPMQVAESRVRVTSPTVPGGGGAQQLLSEVAGATLELSDRSPFVGEVVTVVFGVTVDARRHANIASLIVWDADPMIVEGWQDSTQTPQRQGRNGVRTETRGVFTEPGLVVLEPAMQDLNIETDQGRGGGLFRTRRMRTVTVRSEPVPVEVRPLPPGAPAEFQGAVGRFTLTSELAPERAQVGEPLTWSLTLRGQGNWPDGIGLPARAVPNHVEVIQPRSVRSFEEGDVFRGEVSEDLVLIPTQPGTLRLAPVAFTYFDPMLERYETIEVAAPPVEVLPAPVSPRGPTTAAPLPAPSQPDTPGPSGLVPEPEVGLLPGETAEPRLPRDPVPGDGVRPGFVAAPIGVGPWLFGLLAGALPCGLLVAWLGRRRAARLDPLAARRAARAQLFGLLRDVGGGAPDEDALLGWQRATGALLGVEGRAPTAARLEAIGWGARAGELTGVDADGWRRLWCEVDASIHRTGEALPSDWTERARAVLGATHVRAVPPLAGFKPAHVWPAALVLMLAMLPSAGPVRADRTGLDAYRAGDFADAAIELERRVEVAPLDWKARSDLGLARLQLGELDAALAETSAAFALAPSEEALRWNLAVVSRRAGWIDPALRDLAWGRGAHALARQMSVGAWQAFGWGAGALFWFSVAAAVALRHGRRGPGPALATMLAGVVGVGVSAAMVDTWGALGERGAAFVREPTAARSLPTELADDQVEVALEAGRVVVAEHRFLGWVQVRLANGDVGWVRGETLSPVYGPPSLGVAPTARTEAITAAPPVVPEALRSPHAAPPVVPDALRSPHAATPVVPEALRSAHAAPPETADAA